jgi:hypothetical protein
MTTLAGRRVGIGLLAKGSELTLERSSEQGLFYDGISLGAQPVADIGDALTLAGTGKFEGSFDDGFLLHGAQLTKMLSFGSPTPLAGKR